MSLRGPAHGLPADGSEARRIGLQAREDLYKVDLPQPDGPTTYLKRAASGPSTWASSVSSASTL